MANLFNVIVLPNQRIPFTCNDKEQKRTLMDLEVSMRVSACPFTVQFYGSLFREVKIHF